MVKRGIFFVAVLLLLPISAFAYSDVNNDKYYSIAIDSFTDAGIVQGYPDGTFKPARAINRAEAMKIITLAFPSDDFETTENVFPDVFEDQWYIDFIIEGLSRGIIKGYTDGTFKPGRTVSFAESLKMGLFGRDISTEDVVYSPFNNDIKEDDWYAKHFKYAFDKKLVQADRDGELDPNKPMSRGDFTELIYKIKNLDLDDPEAEFDFSYNWPREISESGMAVKHPMDWEVYELEDNSIFAYFESGRPNLSYTTPNSARVSFVHWSNPELKTSAVYFDEIRDDYHGTPTFEEGVLDAGPTLTVSDTSRGILDYYVYLEDAQVLAGHGVYDTESELAGQFREEIRELYETLNLEGKDFMTSEEKLTVVRQNILVENQGQEMIGLFNQVELFETDTLGVGTGPVDYYYVSELDYTFKYERSKDVILDIQPGKTSGF